MSKRKGRVAPPPRAGGWDFVLAASGWDELCSAAPANARTAWDEITEDPRNHGPRQHRLKGDLGTRGLKGEQLEQWQYEVTAGGRIWYCIDDANKTILMTYASVGHPKRTE